MPFIWITQAIDSAPLTQQTLAVTSHSYIFSLSNNSCHGRIHESFCNISGLRALDLSHNSFNGQIPMCLTRRSSSLRLLNLGGNQLNGHISDTFSTSCDLRFLDLSGNFFRGTIPKSLAKCKHLQVLNLGNNQLIDRFPCFLKNISSLRVMILRSNKLHGHVGCPNNTGNWETLQIVDLASNNFSGSIPSSLGNLKHLESLDLSINSLSGEIPTELARLSFLSVMNLSYNHLVGKIPTGTQIQTFEADSFIGNEGLCGPPLTPNCSGEGLPPPASEETPYSHNGSSIDWNFLSAELGFTFGFGIFILPLIFWKRWRIWYSKHLDDLLYRIIPQLDFVYEHHGGNKYRTIRWKPY
ncbi:Leucine-rich repeat [Sesbania bispinosa]|nr:Leucine-rich repeat [Sesbania bispinosa]